MRSVAGAGAEAAPAPLPFDAGFPTCWLVADPIPSGDPVAIGIGNDIDADADGGSLSASIA